MPSRNASRRAADALARRALRRGGPDPDRTEAPAARRSAASWNTRSPGEAFAAGGLADVAILCCQLIHYPDGSIVEAPIAERRMGVFFCAPVLRPGPPAGSCGVMYHVLARGPLVRSHGLPARPITRCQHERHSLARPLNRRRRPGRARCAARVRRAASAPARADRRGHQHRFRHSRLSRPQWSVDALAADPASRIPRLRCRAAALLGAQHDRLARRRPRATERVARRAGAARRRGPDRAPRHAERRRPASARGQRRRDRTARRDPRRDLPRMRRAPCARDDPDGARSRQSRPAGRAGRAGRGRRRAPGMGRARHVPGAGLSRMRRLAEA